MGKPSLPLIVSLLAAGGVLAVGTSAAFVAVVLSTPNRRRCRPRRL